MQVLGKRNKVLLILVAIVMLVAIGISFAMWDTSAVKATNGNLSDYANAKVGDIIEFGKYYQTLEKDEKGEYIKTPIEWIVVDKDERTGQLTLMSKYILACGSYFGNYYISKKMQYGWNYNNGLATEVGDIPYNQAYIESTARAYLNNLERLDMGGDMFDADKGYIPSGIDSNANTGLLSSVGYSNQRYWTKLTNDSGGNITNLLNDPKSGLIKRSDSTEIYYQRPISNDEYKNRPATRGFYNEAFNNEEKAIIVPKAIAGYIGHRWPDNANDISTKSYVDGAVDKVWLPSSTELNIMNGKDWNSHYDSAWTTPSDESSSTAFEYFENFSGDTLCNALKSTRTEFANNGYAMNYSIPVYLKGTTTANIDIDTARNSSDHYWTRSSLTFYYAYACLVNSSGLFSNNHTDHSQIGVRPCVILKY